MFSLIGSVIGLFTSVGPGIFKSIMDAKQDGRDKAHELAMTAQTARDKRDEAIITGTGAGNVEIQKTVQVGLQLSSKWVVNLSGTVRPVVTYCFFFEFVLLTIALFAGWITDAQFNVVWSPETSGIFAVIISHWFGNKLVSKWVR